MGILNPKYSRSGDLKQNLARCWSAIDVIGVSWRCVLSGGGGGAPAASCKVLNASSVTQEIIEPRTVRGSEE